jgi:hypothetical protein
VIAARAHVVLCLCAAFALWLGAGTAHAQQSSKSRARAAASASAGKSEKRSKPARKAKRSRADRKHPDAPARAAAPEAALPKPDSGSAEAPAPAGDEKPTAEGNDKGDKPAAQQQRAESEVDQADVHKENGTEIKTMEFSGLDIEGQLKTPQMLYFLNRLRAEFGRPRLPHRSFMPELQAGTQDEAMR